jgi:hypothetical protein
MCFDGVLEAANAAGEMPGFQRLAPLAQSLPPKSPPRRRAGVRTTTLRL